MKELQSKEMNLTMTKALLIFFSYFFFSLFFLSSEKIAAIGLLLLLSLSTFILEEISQVFVLDFKTQMLKGCR